MKDLNIFYKHQTVKYVNLNTLKTLIAITISMTFCRSYFPSLIASHSVKSCFFAVQNQRIGKYTYSCIEYTSPKVQTLVVSRVLFIFHIYIQQDDLIYMHNRREKLGTLVLSTLQMLSSVLQGTS